MRAGARQRRRQASMPYACRFCSCCVRVVQVVDDVSLEERVDRSCSASHVQRAHAARHTPAPVVNVLHTPSSSRRPDRQCHKQAVVIDLSLWCHGMHTHAPG